MSRSPDSRGVLDQIFEQFVGSVPAHMWVKWRRFAPALLAIRKTLAGPAKRWVSGVAAFLRFRRRWGGSRRRCPILDGADR